MDAAATSFLRCPVTSTFSSYVEVSRYRCLVVALRSNACSIINCAGPALCLAACLPFGSALAHAAASRSVELGRFASG